MHHADIQTFLVPTPGANSAFLSDLTLIVSYATQALWTISVPLEKVLTVNASHDRVGQNRGLCSTHFARGPGKSMHVLLTVGEWSRTVK